jgi:hypothetical protein
MARPTSLEIVSELVANVLTIEVAEGDRVEAGLRAAYSLVLGLLIGWLVIRADLALTGPKGRGGRRAEEAGPHRPEPRRFAEL